MTMKFIRVLAIVLVILLGYRTCSLTGAKPPEVVRAATLALD
jgi:hypothetical protein